MIATVRIAPVDRRCEPSKTLGIERGAPEVGLEVMIVPASMHMGSLLAQEDCDGKLWDLTEEKYCEIAAKRLAQEVLEFKP